MDYEILYEQLKSLEKTLKDKSAAFSRNMKNISKNIEKGDLKSLSKDLELIQAVVSDKTLIIDSVINAVESFDQKKYVEDGDFAQQMLNYCNELKVDVKGDFPVYEMFPYKIKIDTQNIEMNIDKKRVQCLRPKVFVNDIKTSLDKLVKVNFNAAAFANELAAVYDLARDKANLTNKVVISEPDLLLKDLYLYLTPMQRMRKEYDMQNFAFDIARLYSAQKEVTRDGRLYDFGPCKQPAKLLRILDNNGAEQLIGTIRFYKN